MNIDRSAGTTSAMPKPRPTRPSPARPTSKARRRWRGSSPIALGDSRAHQASAISNPAAVAPQSG